MSVFKCKMCGGTIEFEDGSTVGVCDSCGTKQTLPRLNDDKKVNLYDRANHFRRNNDYDKAMGIYEQILNDDPSDAEAYWSIVLCRYGIEYVEDPVSHKRVPTVNRMQYTSILADEDYKAALEHADVEQKSIYEQEAATIDKIQKDILAISQKEEPFDVFICYKEADENGRRTQDSVLANDLYHQLTQEGFKVFFSRITLEDKIGTAYEPYIFAALNSARVMVVIGTRADYLNAVWVKNEWSRYLSLIRSGDKKTLIPAYRDMDPYDLPEEFSHLQALDMTRLGFMPDLIRGIKKILLAEADNKPNKVDVTKNSANSNVQALVKRGYMALEDGEWDKADAFFEDVLNQDAENGDAYIGKLLTRFKENSFEKLESHLKEVYSKQSFETKEACAVDPQISESVERYVIPDYLDAGKIRPLFDYERTYKSGTNSAIENKARFEKFFEESKVVTRARQYASGEGKQKLDDLLTNLNRYLDQIIEDAKKNDAEQKEAVKAAYAGHLKDAEEQARQLFEKADGEREKVYQENLTAFRSAERKIDFQRSKREFENLNGYKDTASLAKECQAQIERIEKEEKEQEEKAVLEKKEKAKKTKKTVLIIGAAIVAAAILAIIFIFLVKPAMNYSHAVKLMNNYQYNEAYDIFAKLDDYKDSEAKTAECQVGMNNLQKYDKALRYMENQDYSYAIVVLSSLGEFKDSEVLLKEAQDAQNEMNYKKAIDYFEKGDYFHASSKFEELGDYKDSKAKLEQANAELSKSNYQTAVDKYEAGDYESAYELFSSLGDYKDSSEWAKSAEEKISQAKQIEEAYIAVTNINGQFGGVYKTEDVQLLENNLSLIPAGYKDVDSLKEDYYFYKSYLGQYENRGSKQSLSLCYDSDSGHYYARWVANGKLVKLYAPNLSGVKDYYTIELYPGFVRQNQDNMFIYDYYKVN